MALEQCRLRGAYGTVPRALQGEFQTMGLSGMGESTSTEMFQAAVTRSTPVQTTDPKPVTPNVAGRAQTRDP